MFKNTFHIVLKIENLYCGAPSTSEPSMVLVIISFAWGLSLSKMTFSITLLELLERLIVI